MLTNLTIQATASVPRRKNRPQNSFLGLAPAISRQSQAPLRRIKRLAGPGFGFGTARCTLAGFETMAMIRKGQVTKVAGNDLKAQTDVVFNLFQMTA
jgi:hypothetical protein